MFKINVNNSNNQQPPPGLSYQTNVPLVPKTTKITDEYEISNQVLGLGIVSQLILCHFLHTHNTFISLDVFMIVPVLNNLFFCCRMEKLCNVQGKRMDQNMH